VEGLTVLGIHRSDGEQRMAIRAQASRLRIHNNQSSLHYPAPWESTHHPTPSLLTQPTLAQAFLTHDFSLRLTLQRRTVKFFSNLLKKLLPRRIQRDPCPTPLHRDTSPQSGHIENSTRCVASRLSAQYTPTAAAKMSAAKTAVNFHSKEGSTLLFIIR